MPPAPVEQKAIVGTIAKLSDKVIPRPELLAKLAESGYAYLGVGLVHVDSTWEVDREGKFRIGGSGAASASVASIASRALGAIQRSPENDHIAVELRALSERSSAQEGEGRVRVLYLPVIVPEAELAPTAQAVREAVKAILDREAK